MSLCTTSRSFQARLLAKVNAQPESSPLRWVWDSIKNGSMKGLSASAFWRKLTRADGTRDIVDAADLVECSVTPSPALTASHFEVIGEGKALELLGVRALRDPLAEFDLLRLRLTAHDARRQADLARRAYATSEVRALRERLT